MEYIVDISDENISVLLNKLEASSLNSACKEGAVIGSSLSQ